MSQLSRDVTSSVYFADLKRKVYDILYALKVRREGTSTPRVRNDKKLGKLKRGKERSMHKNKATFCGRSQKQAMFRVIHSQWARVNLTSQIGLVTILSAICLHYWAEYHLWHWNNVLFINKFKKYTFVKCIHFFVTSWQVQEHEKETCFENVSE